MINLSELPQIKKLNEAESKLFFYSLLSASHKIDSLTPIQALYDVDYEED